MNCEPCEPCEPCGPCEPCQLLPPLDVCLLGILETFERHASKDDDHMTLSKKELRGMLKEEIGPMMEEGDKPRRLADVFTMMDQDGDKKIDFPEFMTALGVVTCILHNRRSCGPCPVPEVPERCGTITEPIV